jgi:hypothetical protein
MEQYEMVKNPELQAIADEATVRSVGDGGLVIVGGVDLEKFAELILKVVYEEADSMRAEYISLSKNSSNDVDREVYTEGAAAMCKISRTLKAKFK